MKMKNGKHETVHVKWNDLDADIDRAIALLVLELWKAGLITVNSCEDNLPGWVWIEFLDVRYVEKFVSIVARYDTEIESLYNRIRNQWWSPGVNAEGIWRYDAHPFDLAVEETEVDGVIDEECLGPSDFRFAMSVRFPRSDLPVLVDRMKKYNERASRIMV